MIISPQPSAITFRTPGLSLSRFVPGFCGVTLVIAASLCWSMAVYGSPRNAWLYANGVRIVVDKRTVQVADGRIGDVREGAFLVHNLSDRPVRILGAHVTCSCVSTDKTPMTVPAGGTKEVRLHLDIDKRANRTVEQTLTYHKDEPSTPRFAATISCRVIDQ